MTREEIVSALRFCRNSAGCIGCPLYEMQGDCCADALMRGAADLIENQAREIEALTQANAAFLCACLEEELSVEVKND